MPNLTWKEMAASLVESIAESKTDEQKAALDICKPCPLMPDGEWVLTKLKFEKTDGDTYATVTYTDGDNSPINIYHASSRLAHNTPFKLATSNLWVRLRRGSASGETASNKCFGEVRMIYDWYGTENVLSSDVPLQNTNGWMISTNLQQYCCASTNNLVNSIVEGAVIYCYVYSYLIDSFAPAPDTST